MRESKNSSGNASERKLIPLPEPKPLLPLERLISDLVLITDEVRLILGKADEYVMALEKLMTGKLTPTKEVAELNERLDEARSKLALVKESFQEIEDFLSSEAAERPPEAEESSDELPEEDK